MDSQKLYDATRQGLDIILDLVPQAEKALVNPKTTFFKYRLEETDPSAKLLPPSAKYPYWAMADYGIQQRPFSPIDIYMREKGMTSDQFTLALHELAAQFGVEDEKITQQNRPEWKEREKRPDEEEGQRVFETREGFTQAELNVWGKQVTAEILTSFGWKALEYIGTVRNGVVRECHSTESYPIFVQECPYTDEEGNQHTFYKVYQPREYNQQFRFSTIGDEPKNYIFGLEALRKAYRKNNEEKIGAVFLVSGGSDAANCIAMGGQSVWLNSETAGFTQEQHDTLLKYAKRIYQIGDTDTTGKRVTTQRAKRFLDMFTVKLPEKEMNRFRDARGKRRKDLKDFVQIFPNRKDFWKLVKQARCAQFWYETEEKKGEETVTTYHISPTYLNYFLQLYGYYTIYDEYSSKPRYIHIEGIYVKRVTAKDIRNFLNEWGQKKGLPEGLLNLITRSRDLPSENISNLQELNPSFATATATMQLFYFRNCWLEVTAEGIKSHKNNEQTPLDSYVWRDHVIDHDYKEYPPMFTTERREDGTYGARLTDQNKSNVLIYLYRASRLYWREVDEMEQELTEEWRLEEEQCLAAKIACIGYLLYDYFSASNAYAVILQDAQLAENEKECNGRSGKSIFIDFLSHLLLTFPIQARNPRIIDNRFLLDGVSEATRLIAIDECSQYLSFEFFFGMITGKIMVEAKGEHPKDVTKNGHRPKFCFATNYVIKNIDSSTKARLWNQVFSTYYHEQAPNNDYKENRSPASEFGFNLLDKDYPEHMWQADIAFAMQCLQFYLSLPATERKVMPPMGAIERRTQRAVIGKSFEEWASDYYQPGSGHLDVFEDKNDVFTTYSKDICTDKISLHTFTVRLKEYCKFAAHIQCYNPAEFTENKKEGGRIRKGKDKVDQIYVRSVASQHTADGEPDMNANGQTELPF